MAAPKRVLLSPSTCDSVWSSVLFGRDPWEVAMVTPLFSLCPHSLPIAYIAHNWHLPGGGKQLPIHSLK